MSSLPKHQKHQNPLEPTKLELDISFVMWNYSKLSTENLQSANSPFIILVNTVITLVPSKESQFHFLVTILSQGLMTKRHNFLKKKCPNSFLLKPTNNLNGEGMELVTPLFEKRKFQVSSLFFWKTIIYFSCFLDLENLMFMFKLSLSIYMIMTIILKHTFSFLILFLAFHFLYFVPC